MPIENALDDFSNEPVELQSQKYELQNVDGAEELELEGPVVSEAPDADGDGQDADEDQGHKNLLKRVIHKIQKS